MSFYSGNTYFIQVRFDYYYYYLFWYKILLYSNSKYDWILKNVIILHWYHKSLSLFVHKFVNLYTSLKFIWLTKKKTVKIVFKVNLYSNIILFFKFILWLFQLFYKHWHWNNILRFLFYYYFIKFYCVIVFTNISSNPSFHFTENIWNTNERV